MFEFYEPQKNGFSKPGSKVEFMNLWVFAAGESRSLRKSFLSDYREIAISFIERSRSVKQNAISDYNRVIISIVQNTIFECFHLLMGFFALGSIRMVPRVDFWVLGLFLGILRV